MADQQRIAEAFRLSTMPEAFVLPLDYNVAPTTFQPVIRLNRDTGEREMIMMRWGLIPYFAKSAFEFKGFSTINAKAETVLEKALWRAPFQKRRCLIPADGSYEWQKIGLKTKKPFVYTLTNGEPFAFAGLWDAWKDPATGEWLQTFAVITTFANEATHKVRDRMPVILQPQRTRDVELSQPGRTAIASKIVPEAWPGRTSACHCISGKQPSSKQTLIGHDKPTYRYISFGRSRERLAQGACDTHRTSCSDRTNSVGLA